MSKSKHTPGPWTVDGPPQNQIVWSSAENRVCFLAHTNGLDDERDLATGRLIAAAPEMYEAGSEMATDFLILLENVLHAAKTDLLWDGVYEKLLPRIHAWQSALAKAEGRS